MRATAQPNPSDDGTKGTVPTGGCSWPKADCVRNPGSGTKWRKRVQQMKSMRAAVPALLLAMVACTGLRPGRDTRAPEPAPAPVVTVKTLPAPQPPSPPSPGVAATAPADSQVADTAAAKSTSVTPAPESPPSHATPSRSKSPPVSAPSRPASVVQESTVAPKQPVVTQAAGRSPTPAPLDIAALEQRLRDTHAIGVFTKLSLKNQVDDLLAQFRAHFHGNGIPPLSGLRQRYDLLMMKVLSLLQDNDPALAQTIGSSREAIWGVLSDPTKFAAIS